jgi:hypothetical protein
LQGADLARAHLEVASLAGSHLEGARLAMAHLEGANLSGAHLAGTAAHPAADLRGAFFDSATALEDAVLSDARHATICLAGVHWGKVDVSVVAWDRIDRLGDERLARERFDQKGQPKACSIWSPATGTARCGPSWRTSW